jgi:ferrous iron transport protein A
MIRIPLGKSANDCTTLASLNDSQRACIKAVGGEMETRRRLLEMGLCPGVTVELIRRAPLGDPFEFRVRGYLLSLRREQAKLVMVAVMQDAA